MAKIGVRPWREEEAKASSPDLQRASLESLAESWSIQVGGRCLRSQIRASGKQCDRRCLELTQSWEDRLCDGESRKRPTQMWSSDFQQGRQDNPPGKGYSFQEIKLKQLHTICIRMNLSPYFMLF